MLGFERVDKREDIYVDQNFYSPNQTSVAVETNIATVVHNLVTSNLSLKRPDLAITSL